MDKENLHFSIARGGLLYRLQQLVFLIEPGSLRQLLIFMFITWVPLFIFSLMQGTLLRGTKVPFLMDFSIAVRFLLTLPLLLISDRLIDTHLAATVQHLYGSGLVRAEDRADFKSMVKEIVRIVDSIIPEIILFILAFGIAALAEWKHGPMMFTVSSWQSLSRESSEGLSQAGGWFMYVSLPIYRFIVLRWLWHYSLWVRFLWKASRFQLSATVTHPDYSGGLGFLGVTQSRFAVSVFAFSANVSSILAMKVLYDGASLMDFRFPAVGYLVVMLSLFLVPLCFFSPLLWEIHKIGLFDYGALAEEYTSDFEQKWVKGKRPTQERLLGSADIQSLADIGGSFEVVREMRSFPFDRYVILSLGISAVVPFLPLALLRYPIDVLLKEVFSLIF